MILTKITTTAATNKIWISPPIVYEDTKPSTQRISRMTAIVSNIIILQLFKDK